MRESNRYLERQLPEKNDYSELAKNEDELRKKGCEEWGEGGCVEVTRGDISLRFNVKKITIDYAEQSRQKKVHRLLTRQDFSVEDLLSGGRFKGYTADTFTLYQLIDLEIYSEKDKSRLQLKDLVDSNVSLYFYPQSDIGLMYSQCETEAPHASIFITEDLMTYRGLLILFHEIGHLTSTSGDINQELLGAKERIYRNNGEYVTDDDLALLLRDERNAWSYALSKLSPFISSRTKKTRDGYIDKNAADRLVHDGALRSYRNAIKSIRDKREN